nr:uncharacterized protein LOC109190339 [Ipomoea batatas]
MLFLLPGYVVNGFKFQTEEYCYRKSISNYGVSIKGTCLAQFESNFFGTLQEVVEVEYPNVPIKKVVLFNCEWFDPTPNIGSIFNSEYGIAEVHKCIAINDTGILNVRPRGAIDSVYSSSYTYQQDNIPLHTYGGDQSIQDDMQELVHEPLQMNEVELPQSGNHRTDQGVKTEDSEEDDSEEIEEDDNDDSIQAFTLPLLPPSFLHSNSHILPQFVAFRLLSPIRPSS